MSEAARIEQLELQVAELTKQIGALNEHQITGALSQNLVQHIAGQLQALFQNPVMLTGVTSAILNNLQQALVFRAGHSKERQPQLLVLDYYVPGSQRVTLTGEGVLILEQQLTGSTTEADGWEIDDSIHQTEEGVEAIIALLKSYNIDADKLYYITDDLTLQAYREDLTRQVTEQSANREREMAIAAASV